MRNKPYLTEGETAFLHAQSAQEILARAQARAKQCAAERDVALAAYRRAEEKLSRAYEKAMSANLELVRIWKTFEKYRLDMFQQISIARKQLASLKESDEEERIHEIGKQIAKYYEELCNESVRVSKRCDTPEMTAYRHAKSEFQIREFEYNVAKKIAENAAAQCADARK